MSCPRSVDMCIVTARRSGYRLCSMHMISLSMLLCLLNILISGARSNNVNAAGGLRSHRHGGVSDLELHLRFADRDSEEFVFKHNEARAQVGVDLLPMTWNLTLQAFALSWAQNQAWYRDCALEHSFGPFGENIYWASWNSSPTEAVDAWVAERQFYHHDSNSCFPLGSMCGHYTQVVWRESLHLGCASVTCPGTSATFTVCSYDPPGNWIDQLPY